MPDQSKVKLLPVFRSSQVPLQNSNTEDRQFDEQIIGEEPLDEVCEYTCDSWPYRVCKVFPITLAEGWFNFIRLGKSLEENGANLTYLWYVLCIG